MHPCEAALFKPRPDPSGCPDFMGKVVAFAGLGKAPATLEQYMKEAVLVLGCSWSGEMHKGVNVLVNCLPHLIEDSQKIAWTCVWCPCCGDTFIDESLLGTIKLRTFPS